jgi:hypothetical protein
MSDRHCVHNNVAREKSSPQCESTAGVQIPDSCQREIKGRVGGLTLHHGEPFTVARKEE